MRQIRLLLIILMLVGFGCKDDWNQVYQNNTPSSESNLWQLISADSSVSLYVNILKEHGFDTLLVSDDIFTLFIPGNKAVEEYISANSVVPRDIIFHLISRNFIQSNSFKGKKLILTLLGKYAMLENNSGFITIDQTELIFESPLCINGKYFILKDFVTPLPTIFDFLTSFNPVYTEYILSQDSFLLDYQKSKPLGINEDGEIVYDSVKVIYNPFEIQYFPVRSEFRDYGATFVLPDKEKYNQALTDMALSLGGTMSDYSDIPKIWQKDVLIPYLFTYGSFENFIEPLEFPTTSGQIGSYYRKMKNIIGDSIEVFYEPVDKFLCSNGYTYNYSQFSIPDSLYKWDIEYEAEWLTDEVGFNKFAWNNYAKLASGISVSPKQEFIPHASNDTLVSVAFPKGYSGVYSVEFSIKNVFPMRYLAVVGTHMDIGGIYNIYVNDKLVKTFDYYDYVIWRGAIPSVLGGRLSPFPKDSRFNRYDFWVENITDFGDVRIKLEYKGPGRVAQNGLVIDYFNLLPK